METYTTSRGTVIIVNKPELDEAEREERMQHIRDATERLVKSINRGDTNGKSKKKN